MRLIMIIYVEKVNGGYHDLEVSPDDTIIRIKEKIQEQTSVNPDQMRLIFGGKQLEDDYPISKYNIQKNSKLTLLYRLRGGGCSLPDLRNMEYVNVSKPDPRKASWQCVVRGLNLHATCSNKNCIIYFHNFGDLILHQGFGNFDMTKDVHCPRCGERVVVVAMGFFECYYAFAGKISASGKISRGGGRAKDSYSKTKEGASEEWEWLNVVVSEREVSGEDVAEH